MNDSHGSDLQLALNVHPELDPVAVEVFLSHGRAEDVPLELVHHVRVRHVDEVRERLVEEQGCQMAKFDPFLSLDCARVEGVGAQSKERKGSNFAA